VAAVALDELRVAKAAVAEARDRWTSGNLALQEAASRVEDAERGLELARQELTERRAELDRARGAAAMADTRLRDSEKHLEELQARARAP
jgi:chromosome segregation ATPase